MGKPYAESQWAADIAFIMLEIGSVITQIDSTNGRFNVYICNGDSGHVDPAEVIVVV